MILNVKKRDGRVVPFDYHYITKAVHNAFASLYKDRKDDLSNLVTGEVCELLNSIDTDVVDIETIQDKVEQVLSQKDYALARHYITYRDMRTRARNVNNAINKTIRDLIYIDSKDNDDKRENANIDGDSAMGGMLKIGGAATKEFNLVNLISHKYAQLHRKGVIHVHDLDFYALCFNCLQIPLGKLLDRGFATGHGYLRTPATIGSAATLSCIIIQANQNDMYGGQAIPTFDHDLAPYVAKSFVRNCAQYLEAHYDGVTWSSYTNLRENFVKPLDAYIAKHKCIIDRNGYDEIAYTLINLINSSNLDSKCFTAAEQLGFMYQYAHSKLDREVFQSMEATVHNLCTLASRAGAQVPFSSVNLGTCTSQEGRLVTKNLLLAVEAGLGYGETAIFPISVFKLKKGVNRYPGDPNYDLYRLALRATSKRLFPNFLNLDAPFNLKYYVKGRPETEVTAMGCVCGAETSIWKIDDTVHVLAFSDMYKVIQGKLYITKFSDVSSYFDIEHSDIKLSVWDSDANEFVKVKKFIVNSNVRNWRRVTFTNGRTIVVTGDHPLPVRNRGRVLVDELHIGDEIPITSQYPSIDAQHEYSNIDYYWLLGMLICDGALFNTSAVISVGADETDLVSQIIQHAHVLSEPSDSFKVSFVHQQRGAKGNYYDVRISGVKRFKRIIAEFGDSLKKFRHIPSSILDSTTREEKLAFMSGMIDADGYVNAARTNSRVQIGSTNKKLALGQLLIAEYLGLQAKLYQNHYNATDKVRYRVEFFVSEELASYIRCGKKKKLCQGYAGKCPESNTCTVSSIVSTSLPMYSYDVETESDRFDFSGIQSHNCRTRTIANVFDPTKEVVTGRGNLFFTTINLPYLALEALDCTDEHDNIIDIFFDKLKAELDDVVALSLERFEVIAKRKAKNFPFLMGQHLYVDSEKLLPDDEVREVIKHGSMTAGFIGLAEALTVLVCKHHGESEEAQQLGLRIVKFMNDYMNETSNRLKLNFGVMGSPAEGCSGRLLRLTRKEFGVIKGVTDKEYFTNSFHIPVGYNISVYDKIRLEAPYHQYCPAGQISYIELDADAVSNLEGLETIVNAMCDAGMGYFAINHPVDRDPVCGYVGYFPDGICPRCGRREGEGVPASKLLSLKSYRPDPEYAVRREDLIDIQLVDDNN